MKLGAANMSHRGTSSIFARLRRRAGRQHHVQPGHRRLQFRAQFAPAAHGLDIIDARDQSPQHQPALHPFAEIAEPGAGPLLVSRRTLGHRDQRSAGVPILQRRKLHFADLGAEVAEKPRSHRRCRAAWPALTG